MISMVTHHNSNIWGADHNTFNPDRFYHGTAAYNSAFAGYLLHFGQGNRQCIGKNIAMISIWKILITLLKNYHFEAANKAEVLDMEHTGASDKKGPLLLHVTGR